MLKDANKCRALHACTLQAVVTALHGPDAHIDLSAFPFRAGARTQRTGVGFAVERAHAYANADLEQTGASATERANASSTIDVPPVDLTVSAEMSSRRVEHTDADADADEASTSMCKSASVQWKNLSRGQRYIKAL
jgi:hypothetical protein